MGTPPACPCCWAPACAPLPLPAHDSLLAADRRASTDWLPGRGRTFSERGQPAGGSCAHAAAGRWKGQHTAGVVLRAAHAWHPAWQARALPAPCLAAGCKVFRLGAAGYAPAGRWQAGLHASCLRTAPADRVCAAGRSQAFAPAGRWEGREHTRRVCQRQRQLTGEWSCSLCAGRCGARSTRVASCPSLKVPAHPAGCCQDALFLACRKFCLNCCWEWRVQGFSC